MTVQFRHLLLVILASAAALQAGKNDPPGFDFLRWDTGARASAMGGAYAAAAGDLNGIGYNPAVLFSSGSRAAVLSYHNYYLDMQSGFAACSWTIGSGLKAAVSAAYLNYGQMTRSNTYMDDLGTFSPGDLVVTAAAADSFAFGLVWGAAVKYVHQNYDQYTASAVAIDLGAVYAFPAENIRLGLSVKNLGTALTAFVEHKESLPLTVRAGISKRLAHLPLLLQFDLLKYVHTAGDFASGLYWALGGEFTITDRFYLRWGYNSRGSEQNGAGGSAGLAGFSAGLGFDFSRWQLDCGWGFYGILGNVPSVSFYLPL